MRSFKTVLALAALTVCAAAPQAFAQGKIIVVNGNLPGVGFNDPAPATPVGGNTGTTKGEQRMQVFQYAADLWTAVLNPKVDIYVWARFVPLGTNVLGSAGPTEGVRTVVLTRPKRSSTPVIPVHWLLARRLTYGDTLVLIFREA